ncbi:dysbindin protein homolog [Ctenocephalides felis]|uniref:dysbindin protein homolog n=1 Tax=Ctenocephalides felis TaxID=7515 RepID=UPI000E6E2D8B|nr:dysbindin protein homolog [Ctenocephalides felis]
MFNNIRNKLKTVVQDSISSISLTSTADQSINQSSDKFDDVNYFAGCKLLEKYQNDWESMHNLTEENAKTAEMLANLIDKIYKDTESHKRKMMDLNIALANIPYLVSTIDSCSKSIEEIGLQFRNIEKDLFQLENLIEVLEIEDRKLKYADQIQSYKQKKLENLERYRSTLAVQHTQNIKKVEIIHEKELKERQEAFQEAFQNDLMQYQTQGHIERVRIPSQQTVCLEDIVLDQDDNDLLDQFLNQ